MLPADCSLRLVAELRAALDACGEQQRQLDQSLRVCRRLLRAWEPTRPAAPEPTPGPEPNEEDPSPACAPSLQDLTELELLTQALEKAVRVRKGISKVGEGDKAPSLKPRTVATPPATTTSVPPQAPGQAGNGTSETRSPRGIRQPKVPARSLPEHRLLSTRERTSLGRGARATRPSLGDQQVTPSVTPLVPEAFTLKEKGTLLRLPMAFWKAASQNAHLWAQIDSTQASDSANAAARTRFLLKMQAAVSCQACGSLRTGGRLKELPGKSQHGMTREALGSAAWATVLAPTDCVQEYRCLLLLEGLQATVGQCLHWLQELRKGGADAAWSPQPLLYSSTQELQTLAALRLRVAMLDQQLHLEKVLMDELLPLVRTQRPCCAAVCRAVHSLLCNGGQHFPTVLQDEPAD
ncbi:tubulin epsilon and delta complex protein 2 isoform X4 [Elephas maximus indicus]|uniref:tubulin epsilon and delta complex protein 2 isoform X4 n=1 Tax=Elephas maximus indicus TaxID=99487 RepID=UPI002116FC07|nr:tubulin epsilon and delta complex protein 2 isoform X4 [Elephas maximus indicus]